MCGLVLWVAGIFVYEIVLKKKLIEKEILLTEEKELSFYNACRSLALKKLGTALLLAVILGVCAAGVRCIPPKLIQIPEVFHDFESFREFAEADMEYVYGDGFEVWIENKIESIYGGDIPSDSIGEDDSYLTEVEGIDGKVKYVYRQRNRMISVVEFSFSEENPDGLPIRVYTTATRVHAQQLLDIATALLLILIPVETAICYLIYRKHKKRLAATML